MTVQKEVKVKVATEEELDGVEALELRIDRLNKQRIQIAIDIASQKLEDTQAEIEKLKQEKAELEVGVDDSKIKEIDAKIAQLDQESLDLQLNIDTNKLQQAKAETDELDGTTIDIDVNNIKAMEAVDQIGQGFDRLKQGASEVGQQMGTLLDSAGKQETNSVFLERSFERQGKSASDAQKAMEGINRTVADLPGDDSIMQGLLSQALAKDASLTSKELGEMGTAAADYFQAMSYYGKPAAEAFQDMNNYLMTGNTAELERSPILANHIDKLKEATSIQERSNYLQEALTAEGWGGMSMQNTYNNKLETFNGMLERGRYNLGGMFQEGAKYAMDWALQLDESTNGLVGMSMALAGFATPITDTLMGLGQMATGISAIKNLGFIKYLKESALAQWLLNAAQAANPIMLVVLAITALIVVLGYLYFNNEQVRQAIDRLGQSLIGLGQWIYNGAIYWLNQLQTTLMNLWNYIFTLGGLIPANVSLTGNQVIDTILRVIGFMLTLPLQLGMIFMNIIAKALGFGDNFSQRMITGASNAVKGFLRYIQQLPGIVMGEFNRVLGLVNDFINSLPSRVWEMGVAIIDALKKSLGIGSPGHMFYMVEGEFKRIDDLTQKTRFDTGRIGKDMVDNFNPVLGVGFDYKDTVNALLSKSNNQSNKEPPVINFYFNDTVVDDDSRMERIANYITRKLMFDNKTAGRTV